MDNKLLLAVDFIGIDKLSGVIKNIAGAGTKASVALKGMKTEARSLEMQLAGVRKELAAGSGNMTKLIEKEKALTLSTSQANMALKGQQAHLGRVGKISATASAMSARASSLRHSGMNNMMAGGIMLAPFIAAIHEANDYQILQNRLKQFGMGSVAEADAEKFVSAQKIMGVSQRELMEIFIEAQGIFRESGEKSVAAQLAGAKMAAPMMAKLRFAESGLNTDLKEKMQAQELDMLRFVEKAGGTQSAKKFNELIDAGFKASQASGGTVNWQQLNEFMTRAGSSAMNLSSKSIFADMEPLMAMMGGAQAGVGLMTSYNRLNGVTKMPNQVAQELVKMGIWDGGKIQWNSQGGVKKMNGNPMSADSAQLFSTSPVQFYQEKILPIYNQAHLTVAEKMRQNSLLFGRTGGALFNQIDNNIQLVPKSRAAFDKSKGVDATGKDVWASYAGKMAIVSAKWDNFLLVLGRNGGVLDHAAGLLDRLGNGLAWLTTMARNHPMIVQLIGGVGLLSLGLGALQFAFGLVLGPWAKAYKIFMLFKNWGGVGRVVFGTIAKFQKYAPLLGRAFGIMRTAAMFLARGLMRAGLMMLANPMIALIVAIGVVIGVAAYLIYTHWDTIKAAFWKGWAAIKHGAIAGWNFIKSNFTSGIAWLSALPSRFLAFGQNIMSGLVNGITNGAAWVKDKIFGIASDLKGWFTSALGIKSPSRVFMAYGGHITHGLAMGIDRGAHRPMRSVARMAGGVIGAGAMALSTPSMANSQRPARGAAAGPVMHITIQISGTGQSAKTLAQEIKRELDQIAATKARGVYHDG